MNREETRGYYTTHLRYNHESRTVKFISEIQLQREYSDSRNFRS